MLWIIEGYGWYEWFCVMILIDVINDLGLWMTWMTSSCELRALNVVNDSGLWITWTTSSHKHKALDIMNNSIDMKDSSSWAQGSRSSEQLRVVDDMNDLGSYELKPLVAMNRWGLWMLWAILHHEVKPLDAMNYVALWMTWITPSCELRLEILWTIEGCGWHEQLQVVILGILTLTKTLDCAWYEWL